MQRNLFQKNYTYIRKIIIIIFLIIYFFTLIYLSNRQYIWEDESYSLNTSSNNLSDVIKLSYRFEGQPPFYFLLLAMWRSFNSSIFFARLLSVIFVGISAYYFQRLVSLINGKKHVDWLLIIFLLNPFIIWAALEIRLYALIILLSIASLYYFYLFYSEQKSKALIAFLLLSIIGIYTQYFFAFFISAIALCIWIFKGRKRFLTFCPYLIPVIILSVPNLYFLSTQLSIAHQYISSYSIHSTLVDILRTPQNFVLAFNINTFDRIWRWIIKMLFLISVLIATFKFVRSEDIFKNVNKNFIYFCFLVIFMVWLIYLIAVPSLQFIYQDKYFLICFPLFILLFSIFNVTAKIRNLIFIFFSFYFVYLFATKYQSPIKSFDFKKVSIFISKIAQKNEPILFYGKSILPPFKYYYKKQNKLYGIPFIKYDEDYYKKTVKDTSEFINLIKKVKTPTNSYLLVTQSLGGVVHHSPLTKRMIEESLVNHFIIKTDSLFQSDGSGNKLRVRRIIPKAD